MESLPSADAILAVVREHLTSDAAQEQAWRAFIHEGDNMVGAFRAALGDGP
jgi:hypothetical protein